MDNVFQVKDGRYGIVFNDILINNSRHESAVFVIRLPTYDELDKFMSLNRDKPIVEALLEDDLFDAIFEGMLGADEYVDIESIDAGIITTIVNIAINLSRRYIEEFETAIEEEKESISDVEKIYGMVAREFNLPITDVEKMPLNKVFRYVALNMAIKEDVAALRQPQDEE